jgi:hypothetical protein
MELRDMLRVMNALIDIIMFVLFIFFSAFAQATDSSEIQFPKYDFIIAEYCLSFETDTRFAGDKGWKLLRYEQFTPLIIKIQTRSYDYNYGISANLDADIKFSTFFLKKSDAICIGGKSHGESFKCRLDRYGEYNIYDYFDVLYLYLQKIDSAGLSVLFGKVFPIKWNLEFEIDKQPHNISGSYNIKISGMCNKEQLKKIEKSKKNEKSK